MKALAAGPGQAHLAVLGDLLDRAGPGAGRRAAVSGGEGGAVARLACELGWDVVDGGVPDLGGLDVGGVSLVCACGAGSRLACAGGFVLGAERALGPGGYMAWVEAGVPDGQPEVAAWADGLERMRRAGHGHFVSPGGWAELVRRAGLEMVAWDRVPLRVGSLGEYMEGAGAGEMEEAEAHVAGAGAEVRDALGLRGCGAGASWHMVLVSGLARKGVG